jgi:hypothetical protein
MKTTRYKMTDANFKLHAKTTQNEADGARRRNAHAAAIPQTQTIASGESSKNNL